MKVLVATRRTQGDRPGDFSFCVDGELVYLGFVCADDEEDPDGPDACGCGRAFSGLSSRKATTTAEVKELGVTRADFLEAVASGLEAAGWGRDTAEAYVAELNDVVGEHPVGAVLGRRLDEVIVRA